MEEGVERSFETMRELVVTTHVHDNRGEKDEHLFPYEGTIDWNAALKAMAGDLPIVLELKEPTAHPRPLEQAVAVFQKFEQALAAQT
jgi:sugar phosphate isomerase/epimerase